MNIDIQLECGHVLTFPITSRPRPEESELYCHKCHAVSSLIGVVLQWRLKCFGCHFARAFGEGKTECLSSANKHMLTKHHLVVTWNDGITNSRREHKPNAGMDQLALEDNDVPF